MAATATEEALKSIYNYNMIFNNIGNTSAEDDLKFNTNLISDFDLQNFDPKRYEYYVNLLKVFNNDPETLTNLLNKYNSIKGLKVKERKIIREISDYVNKIKDIESNNPQQPQAEGGVGSKGSVGGGNNNELLKIKKDAAKLSSDAAVGASDDNFNTAIISFKDAIDDFKDNLIEEEQGYNHDNSDIIFKFKQATIAFDNAIVAYKNTNQNGGMSLTKMLTNKVKIDAVIPDTSTTTTSPINNINAKDGLTKEAERLVKRADKLIESTLIADKDIKRRNKEGKEKFQEDLLNVLDKNYEEKKRRDEKIEKANDAVAEYKKYKTGAAQQQPQAARVAAVEEKSLIITPLTPLSGNLQEQENPISFPSSAPIPSTQSSPQTPEPQAELATEEQRGRLPPIPSTQSSPQTPEPQAAQQQSSSTDAVNKVSNNILELLASSIGGSKQSGGGAGGAGDDFSDDTLKARYLETRPQRYSKIDPDNDIIKEFRKANEANRKGSNGVGAVKTSNKIEQLSNDIDVYNALPSAKRDDDATNKEIIQKIKRFEDDPKNPLEELELTFDDRIVFIIATFFIRYITIIMVQWCIEINIIKTFYEGFIYYAVIYIILFWFIVLFINIDNGFDVKYMNFNGFLNSVRTLFYYFYMGTNGVSRLLIHTSLIIILIVIPIILNIKKNTEFKPDGEQDGVKILDFEERKQLSKALSLFTMFIWLFTSIIATKF